MMTSERISELYRHFLRTGKVSTDSRSIAVGVIFFALRGSSFNGNSYARDALDKGASLAVVDDPDVADGDDRMFLVDNVLEALQALARHHRMQLGIPIVAITGTNGKTTTKELMAAVLSRKYRLFATYGNLNNHIGVPLTLLSMTTQTQLGIVEMGASAKGEIALLCDIARPDYGFITNIGLAHLEGFGSPDGVKAGKGELYDYLAANGGKAIVSNDDPVLSRMAEERKGLNIVRYDNSFAAGIKNNLTGNYNIANVAAAVASGRLLDVPDEDIAAAISGYVPSNNRSQLYAGKYNSVVMDCYNANPSSMQASIDAFSKVNGTAPVNAPNLSNPEKVLILGDMLELGFYSHGEHVKTVHQAVHSGASLLFFVGRRFESAVSEFIGSRNGVVDDKGGLKIAIGSLSPGRNRNLAIYTYPDTDALKAALLKEPLKNKSILMKGSRGIGLERILDLL